MCAIKWCIVILSYTMAPIGAFFYKNAELNCLPFSVHFLVGLISLWWKHQFWKTSSQVLVMKPDTGSDKGASQVWTRALCISTSVLSSHVSQASSVLADLISCSFFGLWNCWQREDPFGLTPPTFGLCPNRIWPPPPHSTGHSGALFFWAIFYHSAGLYASENSKVPQTIWASV